jgi:hypothetical protein
MDDLIFITYILLIVIMFFYGGVNENYKIEYNLSNFKNENNMKDLFKKLFMKKEIITLNNPINNITEYIKTLHYVQNIIVSYYIKLKSNDHFDIKNNNAQLMILSKKQNVPIKILLHNAFNTQYYYTLLNDVSITKPYSIYNENTITVDLIIVIIKKPFWIHSV